MRGSAGLYLRALALIALGLSGCEKQSSEPSAHRYSFEPTGSPSRHEPIVETPTATPEPSVVKKEPLIALPDVSLLSAAGHSLIVEYEVGGTAAYNRNPHPEAPDARYSGITEGIGYDNSTVSPQLIRDDWRALGSQTADRLAATHPYRGRAAKQHLHEVIDILVTWPNAIDVFDRVDVTRTYQTCRRTFHGFDNLRPNAQAALVSLVFNRGNSMAGPNRVEMRAISDLVPRQDYSAIAGQFRKMERIWVGTEIQKGMTRRREAERSLMLSP